MLRVLFLLFALSGPAYSEEGSPGESENKTETAQSSDQQGSSLKKITVPANSMVPTIINIHTGKHSGHEGECAKPKDWNEWPSFAWCKFDNYWDAERTIAAFTVILAFSTIGLWWATRKLWAAGERALTTTERAFVFIDGFDYQLSLRSDREPVTILEGEPDWHGTHPELVITRFAVQPRWKNSGSTPTRNMRIQVEWISPDRGPTPGNYGFRNDPVSLFIAPQATELSESVDVRSAPMLVNWSMYPVGVQPLILIWGRADYDDVFGGSHFIQWCYRLDLIRPIYKERMTAQFIQWGEYNRTDES